MALLLFTWKNPGVSQNAGNPGGGGSVQASGTFSSDENSVLNIGFFPDFTTFTSNEDTVLNIGFFPTIVSFTSDNESVIPINFSTSEINSFVSSPDGEVTPINFSTSEINSFISSPDGINLNISIQNT